MTVRAAQLILHGAALWCAAAASGCAAGPAGRVALFPQESPALVWPSPPDPPRVRYVGEIVGVESITQPRPGLGEVLFGGGERPARFVTPLSVAVSGDGRRLAVTDPAFPDGPAVVVIDLTARTFNALRTAAGEPLRWPIDAAFVGNELAIADAQRGVVLLVDERGAGRVLGRFERPAGLAWDAAGARLWVVDSAAHAVVGLDRAGAETVRLGGRGAAPGRMNFPAGVASVAAGVAVADAMNFRVQVLDGSGAAAAVFGAKGDGAGDFALPRDVAVDSEGHLYVLDSQFENVQIFDAAGRLLLAWGEGGQRPGEFNVPSGIAIDGSDRIWIADTRNRRVQVFQYLRSEPRRSGPGAEGERG